jgi:uncharacterized protein (TIGR02996 family)
MLPFLQTTRLLPRPDALMHYATHVVRFRRQAIVEVTGLADHLSERGYRKQLDWGWAVRRTEAEGERPTAVRSPAWPDELQAGAAFTGSALRPGWYVVRPGAPVPVYELVRDGDSTGLEFWSDVRCRVPTADIEVEWRAPAWPHPEEVASALVRLDDGPVTADLLDPVRCLFRRPDEAGFWNRIVTDCFDATARLVYADWLDDHDDPHAWTFRESRPFRLDSLRLDWAGAMGRVDCGTTAQRRTLWDFGRIPGRGSAVPFTLADGTPVPEFVAYLLAVTRIRADERLTATDRSRLTERARLLDLSLMADLILGSDDEPICRVTDPARTAALLGGMVGGATRPSELAARLREVNGLGTPEPSGELLSGQNAVARPDEDEAVDGQRPG